MRAVIIAFSMYSRIPMPVFPWEERDRKRAMWFFPLVGAVVGAVFFLLYGLFGWLAGGGPAGFLEEIGGAGRAAAAAQEIAAGGAAAGSRAGAIGAAGNGPVSAAAMRISIFRAALLTAVPVLVTGGIHMDGFLDTCDALAAWGDREKRLEILKDSHIGAFAVIRGILYFLLYFGACTVLTARGAAVTAAGFLLSRAVSGMLVASVPGARESGMLSDFIRDVDKRRLAGIMAGWLVFGTALLAGAAFAPAFAAAPAPVWGGGPGSLSSFLRGGGLNFLAALLAVFLTAFFCRRRMLETFGGITGDLAGYFLQVCELGIVLSQAICSL